MYVCYHMNVHTYSTQSLQSSIFNLLSSISLFSCVMPQVTVACAWYLLYKSMLSKHLVHLSLPTSLFFFFVPVATATTPATPWAQQNRTGYFFHVLFVFFFLILQLPRFHQINTDAIKQRGHAQGTHNADAGKHVEPHVDGAGIVAHFRSHVHAGDKSTPPKQQFTAIILLWVQ